MPGHVASVSGWFSSWEMAETGDAGAGVGGALFTELRIKWADTRQNKVRSRLGIRLMCVDVVGDEPLLGRSDVCVGQGPSKGGSEPKGRWARPPDREEPISFWPPASFSFRPSMRRAWRGQQAIGPVLALRVLHF
jgi:hypothetical protein